MRGTELSFRLTRELLFISGSAIVIIIIFSAVISIWKVMKLEPAIVFKA
jgi:putative ABC transport system permease protein